MNAATSLGRVPKTEIVLGGQHSTSPTGREHRANLRCIAVRIVLQVQPPKAFNNIRIAWIR